MNVQRKAHFANLRTKVSDFAIQSNSREISSVAEQYFKRYMSKVRVLYLPYVNEATSSPKIVNVRLQVVLIPICMG